jgi:hypothetical protein
MLIGCGAKKPTITQQQINQARSNGTLEQLYVKVQQDLAKASGSSKKSLQAIASQIATQIAVDKVQVMKQRVEDARLALKVAPLSLLDAEANKIASIKQLDMAQFQAAEQFIRNEKTLSQDALTKQLMVVNQIAADDQVQKINALSKVAEIAGPGSQYQQDYQQKKLTAIANWRQQAESSIAQKKFLFAATYLRKIIGVDSQNEYANAALVSSQQSDFENNFRKNLESGKPDKALADLMAIADQPMFTAIKQSFSGNINILHDYYINQGLQSTKQGALKGAYKNFRKARSIRKALAMPMINDAEAGYLSKLTNFASSLASKQLFAEQLAYLEIVKEFNPNYSGIDSLLNTARKSLIALSSNSLLIKDFAQTGTHHSAGKSVAQMTYKWVADQLKGDVNLIFEDQLEQTKASSVGRVLVMQGDILQAGVDSETTPGKKTMRVVTETIKKANPAYKKWQDDGAEGSPPEQFLITEKKEDISVNVTYLRKTGILSTSYRLLDQKTDSTLLNESSRDEQTFDAEGNEGVNIGEFKLAFKRPELPSDIQIMEKLSSKVAEQIGDKIKQLLKDPDIGYQQQAESALSSRDYPRAVSYFAYSSAIKSAKSADTSAVNRQLIDTIINQ